MIPLSPASLWLAIEQALKALRYGSVQLIVHEGQVVRIERIERIRLSDSHGSPHVTSGQPTITMEGCPDAVRRD